jgi:hypothetical protein
LFKAKLDTNFIFQRKVEEEANLEAIWGGSWKNEVLEVKRIKNISKFCSILNFDDVFKSFKKHNIDVFPNNLVFIKANVVFLLMFKILHFLWQTRIAMKDCIQCFLP